MSSARQVSVRKVNELAFPKKYRHWNICLNEMFTPMNTVRARWNTWRRRKVLRVGLSKVTCPGDIVATIWTDIMIKTLLCFVACAVPLASYAETPHLSNGVMVDESGMTLYTFDKDTEPGKSACAGECATIWPAAMAHGDDRASGDWSFVTVADGQKQWAYKGHPLYRFSKDTQPGQAAGDGVKGVWHIAKP